MNNRDEPKRFTKEEIMAETDRAYGAIGMVVDGLMTPAVINACGNIIMNAAREQSDQNKAFIARGLADMAQQLVDSMTPKESDDVSKNN